MTSEAEQVSYEEIPVVKVLIERDGGVYETPFYHKVVPPCVIRGEVDYEAYGEEDIHSVLGVFFEVGGGYIHTLRDGSESGYLFPELVEGVRYVTFRCVIPIGVRYWSNEKLGMYASKRIRFIGKKGEVIDIKNEIGNEVI